ncbi:hypothetical protein DY000_02054104 [Brassica cretica]|uniref:Uncharacterized protein n=1 Tax=Brassica cretica TaxID=69181 RepID=A0ABQ7AAH4_BRACR|nr:hypothetical protein DY000_02054104 [Brassica cretica]
MMEVDEDRDDGWGVFDCEIFDRKVAYMVDLLKSGHKFQKGEWGGGDASEPVYVHEPVYVRSEKENHNYNRLTRKLSVRRLTLKSSMILFRDSGQTLLILDDFHV